jgi:hypothetical protein
MEVGGDGFAVMTSIDGDLVPVFYLYHNCRIGSPVSLRLQTIDDDPIPKLVWDDMDRGGSKTRYVWGWTDDPEFGPQWVAWLRGASELGTRVRHEMNFMQVDRAK